MTSIGTPGEKLNEVDFCARVASAVNQIVSGQANLLFGEARVEGYGSGPLAAKRKDLRFYDRSGKLVLCGEVKLPGTVEGRSPYDDQLIRDAHEKADNAGVRFFFTWNVNTFVVWDRQRWDVPLLERRVREWRLGLSLAKPESAGRPDVQAHLGQKFLPGLLADLTEIISGRRPDWAMPPDDFFVRTLESHLDWPVQLARDWLAEEADRDTVFGSRLEGWMAGQDWSLVRTPREARLNALEVAARSLAHIWANRLIFYKILRDRFTELPKPELKPTVKSPGAANRILQEMFEAAVRRSGDYEPLLFPYAEDWASPLVFEPEGALDAWRGVLRGLEAVEFQSVPSDVVGRIFQRLISPEERHKYGQHFTGTDVVDLINAFCIRGADDAVLDPACGSGSFLVRAYHRKKALNARKTHPELISEIYGSDIALYPAHLATLNLAAREINEEANYPRITRKNFFAIRLTDPFVQLPDGKRGFILHSLPVLDAVVGNPPYVEQGQVPRSEKERAAALVAEAWPGLTLSGRSDYHCYFWPAAARYLKEDGYFGFLTSSSWLDVEYGFPLQAWLLKKFCILAIMESAAEPWFQDARIKTCVAVLRRCKSETACMSNLVKFVQFKKPLAEIIGVPSGDDERERQRAVERLRERIERTRSDQSDDQLRIIVKRQGDLWNDGVRAANMLGDASPDEAEPEDNGENGEELQTASGAGVVRETAASYVLNGDGEGSRAGRRRKPSPYAAYRAGKWGRYLRAPDFYFDVMREFGNRFAPLGGMVGIRRGITSGCDDFFMPHDITDEVLRECPDPGDFRRRANGAERKDVVAGRLKIVRAGDGSVHPIETEFLAPEVHSPMEIDRPIVRTRDLSRVVLLVDKSMYHLKGTWVWRYLRYGETQPFGSKKSKALTVPKRSSCAARVRWYDLTKLVAPGFALWPMTHKYRHIVPANAGKNICNKRYFDILDKNRLPGAEKKALLGILNSSLIGFFKAFYGRYAGTEMTLDTEVVDVCVLEVPDPRGLSAKLAERIVLAFSKLIARPTGHFLEDSLLECTSVERAKKIAEGPLVLPKELQQPDRRELDEAVFELLGVKDVKRRKVLVDRLYEEIARYFRAGRVVELQANENKKLGKARRFSPDDLAADAWDAAGIEDPTPLADWIAGQPGPKATVSIPDELPASVSKGEMFDAETVYFGKGRKTHLVCSCRGQAELVARVANLGINGEIGLPTDKAGCQALKAALESRLAQARARFEELAGRRTSDERRQEQMVSLLMQWFVRGRARVGPPT